jgi:hypothetical protein
MRSRSIADVAYFVPRTGDPALTPPPDKLHTSELRNMIRNREALGRALVAAWHAVPGADALD